MAVLNKIDSNQTGLRFAEELSFKVLPGSPIWKPLEPNTYADFGGEVTTVARNPINDSAQREKGVVVDVNAAGGFNTDVTQENLQELLQGFFFADLRTKDELSVADVDGTGNDYEPAAGGDGYVANDLLFAKGFDDAPNNGLKVVTGTPTATSVPVTDTGLVDASTQSGTISRVGFEFAAGDLDVDASGALPVLTTTTKDLTELSIIPGEWIFLGGDTGGAAGNQFLTAANNGFKRVRSVSTNAITIDKSDQDMVTEASTAETLRIFFGRVLKNELGTLIKRRTYQLERTLGFPDDATPSDIQAEYLVGAVPSELTLNVPSNEKMNADLAFVAGNSETIDGPTSLKTGSRPGLTRAAAFNTSSDFSRIRMAVIDPNDEAPTPLFAFIQEMTLTINNNLTPNKAVGCDSSFEVTRGTFEVGGSLTAYFQNVSSINSVRNNDDVTMDFILFRSNTGVAIDIPLLTLSDGRPTVELNAPILIPIEKQAARGGSIDPALDHTLLMCFYDYLPTAANIAIC